MSRRLLGWLVLAVAGLLLAGCHTFAITTPATPFLPTEEPDVEVPVGWDGGLVYADELPPEAIDTLLLISAGGPFPYDQDGATFQNREGVLPTHPRGYYHEYTVETPGSADRGARRVVTGDAGERFYTDDHYESFRFVVGEPGG